MDSRASQSYWKTPRYIKRVKVKKCFIMFMRLTTVLIMTSFIGKINKIKDNDMYKVELNRTDRTRKILYWNGFFGSKDFGFPEGMEPFFSKCNQVDCYVTHDKYWIPVQYFDAVIFHGPEFELNQGFPETRYEHQRYIYFSMESPMNRPVSSDLDKFFNWTMTYRTNSDVKVYYFNFLTHDGNIVSPADHPKWIEPLKHVRNKYMNIAKRKSKAIAWFVSNCYSKNNREQFVMELQKYIQVDIYGDCGPLKCPRDSDYCGELLKGDYYFYLSFENSNCKDYVTEKVLNALENEVVPVVYNGADLNKYLPPNSYVDASGMSAKTLAMKIKDIIDDEETYASFFWWKDFYRVQKSTFPFCELCEMLHENSERKVYDIMEWWHGTDNNQTCMVM